MTCLFRPGSGVQIHYAGVMQLRSLVFLVRVLAVCVILSCSSARAFTCPGKISFSTPCNAGLLVSSYTALLFTVQFVLEYWSISAVADEISKEEQKLQKLSDLLNQLAVVDEARSVKNDSASFMTMLEKLKKYYIQNKQADKAKKVKNVLYSYRLAPSYYVFIYDHSPYSYEHCLRTVVRESACQMIPVRKEPLKLISLAGLTMFFDQLVVYFGQQRAILNSMQVSFSQLFQIGVSYCGNYLNLDPINITHPCMKMVSIHIQNYPVINEDWSKVIKMVETDVSGSEEKELKMIFLSDKPELQIGQYKLNGFFIEPVEH